MTLVFNGHDMSGPTANRPTNADVGQPFFDTTLQEWLVFNGSSWQPSDTFEGTITAIAGAAGSGTTAGGAGASGGITGGAGGSKTDPGHAAGGPGGSVTNAGGAGGNTASNGSDNAGAGGSSGLTGGAGGNATAGTGNGGAGGDVPLTPGAGGTSAGGSAGTRGVVNIKGPLASPVTAVQALSNSSTIVLPTTGTNALISETGNTTGNILAPGIRDGQEVTLVNISAFTVTFAAAGTSNVAAGTSAVIAANRSATFKWSATQSLWY